MASLIAQPKRGKYKGKGGARRAENERVYGIPLPILFSTSTTPDAASGSSQPKQSFLSSLFNPPRTVNPHCTGTFDAATRSVWVTDERDVRILWTRGFWGKGNLSRSEPSWRIRAEGERRDRKAGKCMCTISKVLARASSTGHLLVYVRLILWATVLKTIPSDRGASHCCPSC